MAKGTSFTRSKKRSKCASGLLVLQRGSSTLVTVAILLFPILPVPVFLVPIFSVPIFLISVLLVLFVFAVIAFVAVVIDTEEVVAAIIAAAVIGPGSTVVGSWRTVIRPLNVIRAVVVVWTIIEIRAIAVIIRGWSAS